MYLIETQIKPAVLMKFQDQSVFLEDRLTTIQSLSKERLIPFQFQWYLTGIITASDTYPVTGIISFLNFIIS